jgi:hypothetical protein
VTTPRPLAPGDRRLRHGRFEVSAFGPKNPETSGRRRLSGPHRFATEADARAYAAELTGDRIFVDRVAPSSSRYPDGPWTTTTIADLPGRPS